jgi:ribosome-binding factor A
MTRQNLKPQSQRQRRVGEEIRQALVHIIERGHFRDPDLAGVSVTVTGVRVSPDLRHARVGVLRFGGGDSAVLAKALNRACAYLRGQLAQAVRLRHAPELKFEADATFARAAELDRLFLSPSVVRDLGAPAEGDKDEEDGRGP